MQRTISEFALSALVVLSLLALAETVAGASSSVPDPPQNVQADIIGMTTNIYWQAPLSDGGSPVTSYYVSLVSTNPGISSPSGGTGTVCSTVAASQNCAFNGSSTTYYVFALNSTGYSAPAVVNVPSVPTGQVSALRTIPGHGQIEVTWDAYYASPGTALLYQIVMSSTDMTFNGHKCVTTTLHCVFKGLLAGIKYDFIVQATDGHGGFTSADVTGLVSTLTSATSPTTTAKPFASLAAPYLSISQRTYTGVTLHWRMSASSLVPASYYIIFGTSPRFGSMHRLSVQGAGHKSMSYLVSGLRHKTRYYFIVEARLTGHTSRPSNRTTAIG